jgi:pyruvate/2-oxoglutarate dehydrogenase complex dihydrolipoamide dehydrogenase (E3) component
MSANFVPYVKYAMGVSHCAVNPWFGLTSQYLSRHIPRGHQRVLVIGGGPAGMMAALGAAECGHKVILCEKSAELGGMLRYAWQAEFKRDIKERFVDVLERRIKAMENIELRLNTEVTPQLAQEIAADALIVCIGAQPILPAIPGLEDERVLQLEALRHKRGSLGPKIVIIGGGLSGCEEGVDLAKYHGKDVTIVEMSAQLAQGAPYVHYLALLNEMEQLPNLHIQLEERAVFIDSAGLHTLNSAGEERLYEADQIILAAGLRPLKQEAAALCAVDAPAIMVGDCREAAQMNEAVLQGYFAGYHLQRI